MNLSSGGSKNPVCKFSWSYDDRYYIDFMVRTDPRITDTQTDTQTHPQTTSRVSVETYRPRGETIGFKKCSTVFFRKTPLSLKTPPPFFFLPWQHRKKMPHLSELMPESMIIIILEILLITIFIASIIFTLEEFFWWECKRNYCIS